MKAIVNYNPNAGSNGHEIERVVSDPEAESIIGAYSGDVHQISTWFKDGWRIETTAGYAAKGTGLPTAMTLVLVKRP